MCIRDSFDTAAPEDAHSGIIIPLRNMINEAYALDIGRKIRAQPVSYTHLDVYKRQALHCYSDFASCGMVCSLWHKHFT